MTDLALSAGAVVVGALIGAPARLFVTDMITRRAGEVFPWATLAINVSGSCAIGAAAGCANARGLATDSVWWLVLVTGVLGSFTTVSTFSLQTLSLARQRRAGLALVYVAVSLSLCVAGAAGAFALASALP